MILVIPLLSLDYLMGFSSFLTRSDDGISRFELDVTGLADRFGCARLFLTYNTQCTQRRIANAMDSAPDARTVLIHPTVLRHCRNSKTRLQTDRVLQVPLLDTCERNNFLLNFNAAIDVVYRSAFSIRSVCFCVRATDKTERHAQRRIGRIFSARK